MSLMPGCNYRAVGHSTLQIQCDALDFMIKFTYPGTAVGLRFATS